MEKNITNIHYSILLFLIGLVYTCGLFVPLMDNDAAHHANIALRMYLTGDFVNLVDNGQDYLDKPHLHFWLAALSYKLFGVNSFAYRLPSFLFTILGTYAVYKTGQLLYNSQTGMRAVLIILTAFAYMLANTDVRMDAILTACISFSTWQLLLYFKKPNRVALSLAALGLAAGFSTKGWIAVIIPGIMLLVYVWQKNSWRKILNGQSIMLILLFFLFISPVLYCYYLQFDLHPEKIIRGKNHVSGLQFILWKQNTERLAGQAFGNDGSQDHFFFFHSFLWAFAPWSLLFFMGIIEQSRQKKIKRYLFLLSPVLFILLLLTFGQFKLPHYLNIILPYAAVFTAAYITGSAAPGRLLQIQKSISVLLLLIAAIVHSWIFPLTSIPVIVITTLLLALVIYYWKHRQIALKEKIIFLSAATMILTMFLMNVNFYPRLLQYQGGNELAFAYREMIGQDKVYFTNNTYSSSFVFFTQQTRKELPEKIPAGTNMWIVTDDEGLTEVANRFYILRKFAKPDYEITRLRFSFLDPEKRQTVLHTLYLLQVQAK